MGSLISIFGKAALSMALVASWCGSARAFELTPTLNGAYAPASWLVTYNWSGPSGTSVFTFTQTNVNGGTFTTQDGNSGRYFQRPGDARAVLSFNAKAGLPAWSCIYSLTVAAGGRSFSGINGHAHTSGSTIGTHTAVRVRSVKDPGELRNLLLEGADEVNSIGETLSPAQAK